MKKIFFIRTAMLALIALTSVLIFTKNIYFLFSLCFLSIVFSLIFDRNGKLMTRIKPLVFIALTVILFQLVFNTSIDLTNRLIQGFTSSLKIFSLSLMVFLFTAVVSLSKIAAAFSFLPKKLLFLVIVTFGMIPAIFTETYNITIAQNSRGKSNLFSIIIPLLHRTLLRAEQIAISIQARGYDETN